MPTMAESGSHESRTYSGGVVAPAAHREGERVDNAALNRGLASQQIPEGVARTRGATAAPHSQETLRTYRRRGSVKWNEIAQTAKVRPE